METDAELLCRYAQNGDEAAFTELVRRHIALVYSAAFRETGGDSAAAKDVTQLVFIELARKAGRLRSGALAGWLYTSVRHVSANQRRAQQRRAAREQKAYAMNEPLVSQTPEPSWENLRPVLDNALHELNEEDRNAVVLRCLEGNSLQEVGAALGLSDNAARMRVDRALEKLRGLLAKRGVTSTASGLVTAFAAGAIMSAPATLAASVASGALAAVPTASTALTVLKFLAIAKLKLGLLSVVLVAGLTTFLVVRSQGGGTAPDVWSGGSLTGLMLFSSDPAGRPAGNSVWDTRGANSDFYKIWVSRGVPQGDTDGLTGAFLNGPTWAAAPLDVPLAEGTNQFTLFFQHNGTWPTFGLNLFFNSNTLPSLSVYAPLRTNDSVAPFSPNHAPLTFSLTSYPSANTPAPGRVATTLSERRVELTEYHVAATNLHRLDRVSTHAASSNGRFDYVGTFTLVVGPPGASRETAKTNP